MLIFGGTTEGRRLARALSAMGHQVWVSVATPLGAEELAGLEEDVYKRQSWGRTCWP